jgi:hypothetical protein
MGVLSKGLEQKKRRWRRKMESRDVKRVARRLAVKSAAVNALAGSKPSQPPTPTHDGGFSAS